VLIIRAVAAVSRLSVYARRADSYFESITEELFTDPAAFWKRHRAKVVVLATSAAFSGLATVVAHRLTTGTF
jgi:hypothetical protein